MAKKPVALLIMDGFGVNLSKFSNAIAAAKTPNLDKLFASCPYTMIGASGLDVGLPDGQMGNSEVGHTNIGAGRVVYQMLVKITKDIQDGSFFKNPALVHSMENAKEHGGALHLMGLSLPAASIPTRSTSTASSRWPSGSALRRSMSMPSSTVATSRRLPLPAL